jgi:hypothetical protein
VCVLLSTDDVYKDVHKAIKGIDKQIGSLL